MLIKLKLITRRTLVIYIWCAITPGLLIKINIASFAEFAAARRRCAAAPRREEKLDNPGETFAKLHLSRETPASMFLGTP